jgi:hypothetical protein
MVGTLPSDQKRSEKTKKTEVLKEQKAQIRKEYIYIYDFLVC